MDLDLLKRRAPATRDRAYGQVENVGDAPTWSPVFATLNEADNRTQAQEALIGLGWKSAIAKAAVAAASTALGAEPRLERMIFEALRQCPQLAC